MSAIELYGARGWGSTVIEALLERAGAEFVYREVDPSKPGPATDALKAANPLAQIPTLKLSDGTVMTESAAMIIALDDLFPAARLVPPSGDSRRPVVLRWIVFIAGNMYPAISVGDYPERWVKSKDARAELKDGAVARLKDYWTLLEQSLQPAPYLAGSEMTALDVYAAMLSRWRPGRAWVDEHCARVAGALALAEQDPVVARVWAKNFKR
ncbi:MAG: glutathione S-transferase family protein [Pseudomonadota bacterium]|nr:glutathione S-transferase family protein [Pseudomonadota bacterium]